MADITQQIIIEFVPEYAQLDKAIDSLEKMGTIDSAQASQFKATTAEINKQSTAIKATGSALNTQKKNFDEAAKSTKKFTSEFAKGFEEGIIAELKKAGLTMEQFFDLLKKGPQKAGDATESLRSKLRGMTEELTRLKAAGQDNTEQYKKLALEAGNLKDAMADVQQEIKAVGSDTSTFDGLIGVAQGVAGGFAIAQGAAALFGDESEELQKTLLRVNAAMAILQGLQQVGQLVQKESAASKVIDIAVTKAQTVAQKAYALVVGQSTGALKVFKLALAATGVGLLIFALVDLISSFNNADDSLEELNAELDRNRKLVEADTAAIKDLAELEEARAKAAGAKESELIKIRGRSLISQINTLKAINAELVKQRDATDRTSDAYNALNSQIAENEATIKKLNQEAILKGIELQTQLNEEQKKGSEDAKKQAEEAAKNAREGRVSDLNEEIAKIKLQLLATKEGSFEELELKKQVVALEAEIELEGEKLKENQKELIRQQAIEEQVKLHKEYNARIKAEDIQAEIDRNTAILSNIQISNDQRLMLTISNIELAAQLEVDAAKGNSAKIIEINAKRDADIRDTRKKFIEEALQYELELNSANNGSRVRALNKIAADEKRSISERVAAINTLASIEQAAIDKRILALEDEDRLKLVSDEEYILRYAQLMDQKTNISVSAEEKITAAVEKENNERMERTINSIKTAISVATQVADLITSINDLQTQQEQQRVEAEKTRISELLEAGAITEREAARRTKRLEAEERRARILQAQREKQAALFKAFLAIPQAFLQGLAEGGPILGAIYAAIAGAELALIAARPLPKFGKGKSKGEYEGLGEVGERGAELVEKDGRMYVVQEPTIMWLARDDKVYNPAETQHILNKGSAPVGKSVMGYSESKTAQDRDYRLMAKEFGKELKKIPGVNLSLDRDGFNLSIQEGQNRINYMNKRYSSKS